MKNSIKFLGIALLLLFNVSCSNEELETENIQTTEDKSISDYIASKSEYSDIAEAFKMTDFNSYLENENARLFGSYTFFLPTNEAFRTFLNENGFSSLAAVPPAALREILANHLLNTRLFASQIQTGYVSTNASGPNNSKISMYLDTFKWNKN
ncbi:MAG: hypothetical protein HC854_12280 [Flavobacterium sp.]|nr:hypothetical protein [Flavobacterium sp.]